MRITKAFLFAAVAILFVLGGSAYAYRPVIDLGTLGGDDSCAYSINDSGQIVGRADGRACLFDPTGGGDNIDLGSLGGDYSEARSINDSGQIVGMADDSACLFDPTGAGANTDLSGSFTSSRAYSINDDGQIVGVGVVLSYISDSQACIFDPTGGGDNTTLGPHWVPIGYWSKAAAYSINDSGQIVGHQAYPIGEYEQVACRFDYEDDWPLFLDDSLSSATSINNNGQIVGYSGISALPQQAYLFDPTGGGANTGLGTIDGYDHSIARCINDNDQIVGEAFTITGPPYTTISRACLFDPTGGGANTDLNTLIDPSCGWTLECAYSINNNGWIVGVGTNPDGDTHAYLLIPEPGCAALMIVGATILSLYRRK